MIRTQVSLTEEQMALLRAAAARRGVSIAEVVRTAVAAELERDDADERRRRARETVGAFRSGTADLGRRHDAYLADAYADEAPAS